MNDPDDYRGKTVIQRRRAVAIPKNRICISDYRIACDSLGRKKEDLKTLGACTEISSHYK